jgi:diadenosine tetraphosphatase ApaH/serine/threonine PP2A family protein phosphatase
MHARRVAALYDIHGNLPGLDAVLAEIRSLKPDAVVLGGDLARGPMPASTLDRLLELDAAFWVRGNADRQLVEAFDRPPGGSQPAPDVSWAAARLSRHHRDLLSQLPLSVTIEIDELGPVLFCHGSPGSDEEIITARSPDETVARMLAPATERLIVCGHTHVQFDRRIGDRRVVNAGSVGLPYEWTPGAYWLLLGPGIHLRRTDYDLDTAIAALRRTGYPDVNELLAGSLVAPIGPERATARFEQVATERGERGTGAQMRIRAREDSSL